MNETVKEKLSALELGESIVIRWAELGKRRSREPGTCGFDNKMFHMEPTPFGMKLTRVL